MGVPQDMSPILSALSVPETITVSLRQVSLRQDNVPYVECFECP